MLKKCIGDPESILPISVLCMKDNLSFEEFHSQILYMHVKKLKNNEVASIKVLWKNHLVEGVTSEVEAEIKSHYPYLFDN